MLVDPRAEWAEIFKEAWRTQRAHVAHPARHGQRTPRALGGARALDAARRWQFVSDERAGALMALLEERKKRLAAEAFGGEIGQARQLVHGKAIAPSDAVSNRLR